MGIIFRGKLLENSKTLLDYGFKPGNKLNVIARSKKKKKKEKVGDKKLERRDVSDNLVRLDQIGDMSLKGNRFGSLGNQLNREIQEYRREIMRQEPNEGQILANLMKVFFYFYIFRFELILLKEY